MAYLTRDQAVAELARDGLTSEQAEVTLGHALRMCPQAVRTTFLMVTGYKAGTCLGAWPEGRTEADLFTISEW